jgi:hypothetical protein
MVADAVVPFEGGCTANRLNPNYNSNFTGGVWRKPG